MLIKNTVRRTQNHSQRSMMRTYIKSAYAAIENNDKEKAQSAYNSAVSVIDRTSRRGLHHKNKSAH